MTKKDWVVTCNRMKRIIGKDASTRYLYKAGHRTCVIGGLAVAAGIELPATALDNGNSIDRLLTFARALCRAYPVLTMARLTMLQKINDCHSRTRARRKYLLDMIDKWEK